MTATSTAPKYQPKGNPNWKRGAPSANPHGRPKTEAGIRRRLMEALAARILDGDKAAVDAYVALERSGAGE